MIWMLVISVLLSIYAAAVTLPHGLGASIWALMFWALAWVIEWGQVRYARSRRKYY